MDLRINKVIAITITILVGKTVLSNGLKFKLNAIAPPILDKISNDNPRAMPKNIFLPNETSRVEP